MNSKEDCNLKAIAYRIRNDDDYANQIGLSIAETLNCKRSKEHKDRWITNWGTKTNIGLARTILSSFETEGEKLLKG